MERLALPVAVDADVSQLHFRLDVAEQSFGIHQVLHIWYEKAGSTRVTRDTRTPLKCTAEGVSKSAG